MDELNRSHMFFNNWHLIISFLTVRMQNARCVYMLEALELLNKQWVHCG